MCEAIDRRMVTWCIKADIDIIAMRHNSMPANANCSLWDLPFGKELAPSLSWLRENRLQLIYCNAPDPCYLSSAQNYQVSIISHDQPHSVRLAENPCPAGMRSDAPCPLSGMCASWESGTPPPHSFSSPHCRQPNQHDVVTIHERLMMHALSRRETMTAESQWIANRLAVPTVPQARR
jgi:hypothetical protein